MADPAGPLKIWAIAGSIVRLPSRGGFSGTELFRIDSPRGELALRAWPASITADRLQAIHAALARARQAGLSFVPNVALTPTGASVVTVSGHVWDLVDWLPGAPNFAEAPTDERLRAACSALGQLHAVWRSQAREPLEPCPAIARRLRAHSEFRDRVASGWRPSLVPGDPLSPLLERAWQSAIRHADSVPKHLATLERERFALHWCHGDLWHGNILYQDVDLTGFVDFGNCRRDHPAVDLARLLGSLAGDDNERWQLGLDAYAKQAPLSARDIDLAHALDLTGTIVSLMNWLKWLTAENQSFANRVEVGQRLEELLARDLSR